MIVFVLAKSTIMDTRVKYRILGFRLIIGCLEEVLKGCIYSLIWTWFVVTRATSNGGVLGIWVRSGVDNALWCGDSFYCELWATFLRSYGRACFAIWEIL